MPLRGALIGTGFMGECYALAWHSGAPAFDIAHPRLKIWCDATQAQADTNATQLGFARATVNWEAAVAEPTGGYDR